MTLNIAKKRPKRKRTGKIDNRQLDSNQLYYDNKLGYADG
jgi:hypothetical protein